MATFNYRGITYTAFYVDTTGSAGDGSSPAQSANTFPTWSTVAANTAIIVRRTSTISVNGGSINSNNNIMLCRSPLLTDDIYPIIPDASVWVADVQERPILNITNANNGLEWSGINPVCYGMRIDQAVSTAHTTNKGIITFSNVNGNGVFVNCFITRGNGSYISAPSITIGTTRGIVASGNNLKVNNNTFEIGGNSAVDSLFINNGCNSASISNNIFNSWARSGSHYAVNINNITAGTGNNVVFSSNLINMKCLGAAGPLYGISHSCTSCNSINNKFLFIADGSNATIACYNISAINRSSYISDSYEYDFISGTISAFVYNSGSVINGLFKDCRYVSNSLSTATTTVHNLVTGSNVSHIGSYFDFDGVVGNTSTGVDTCENSLFSGCTFIKVSPILQSPTYIPQVNSTSHTHSLGIKSNAVVYVDDFNMLPTPKPIFLRNESKLFIKDIDVDLGVGPTYNYLEFATSTEEAAVYVQNENNIQGKWTARTRLTELLTSNTYRVGGKNYSIYGRTHTASATANKKPYIYIAPTPFIGIPLNFGTTGNKKITLYFAEKLYDIPTAITQDDLFFTVDIPSEVSGSNRKSIDTRSEGVIFADTSTWQNDPGLTPRKIELTFNLLQAGDVYCRIGFHKYVSTHTSGYIVIDPDFVTESV